MKTHDKILIVTGWLTILATAVLLAVFIYLSVFQANPPAKINNIEFLEDTAVAGERTSMRVDLCRYTDAQVTLHRAWINDLRFLVPTEFPANLGLGCHEVVFSVAVPSDLPAGEYRMEYEFIYHVNVLADRSVEFITDQVTITAGNSE